MLAITDPLQYLIGVHYYRHLFSLPLDKQPSKRYKFKQELHFALLAYEELRSSLDGRNNR